MIERTAVCKGEIYALRDKYNLHRIERAVGMKSKYQYK